MYCSCDPCRSSVRSAHQLRRRGSVMILVVVAIVLMAMLGMAYLQVTRLDRVAAAQMSQNNIDVVASATLAYIAEVLRNDIVDSQGNVLAASSHIEPYDYPWTNDDSSFPVKYADGSTATAKGGTNDDTWLASTEPDFSGNDPAWPHITNLTGTCLRLPRSNGQMAQPDERAIDNAQWRRTDTSVEIEGNQSLAKAQGQYDAPGADADGDGILDSRWTWAPLRQMAGVSYIMAVRIIDNSSLLNASVATSMVSASGEFDPSAAGTNAPQWLYPTELDLGRFMLNRGGTSLELRQLLKTRLGYPGPASAVPLPTPWYVDAATPHVRSLFWLAGPSLWGNYNGASVGVTTQYQRLSINDEIELRQRNGLNNAGITTSIESTSAGLGLFLRAATTESTYTDVPGVNSIEDYFNNDSRHLLTTRSGASILAQPLPGEEGLALKRDINVLKSNPQAVADIVTNVLTVGDAPRLPSGINDTTEMATRLALNLKDYADPDNTLSELDGQFGFEPLPMISEVYVQRPYRVQSGLDLRFIGFWFFVDAVADSSRRPGYAVEIRNPFRQPIPLTGVYLYIAGRKVTNGASGADLDTLAGAALAAANGGDRRLQVGQALIIHRPSSVLGSTNGNNNITTLFQNDAPAGVTSPIAVQVSDGLDLVPNGDWSGSSDGIRDAEFELRASGESSGELPWSYCSVTGREFRESATACCQRVRSNGNIIGDNLYIASSRFANPNGLNLLAYRSADMKVNQTDLLDATTGNPLRSTVMDRLGLADKTQIQTQSLPGINFTVMSQSGFTGQRVNPHASQFVFNSTGSLRSVGELALVSLFRIGPGRDVATSWGGETDPDQFLLDLDGSRLAGAGNFAIPHALLLMDRFVTQSPAEDYSDNDGDGVDSNHDGFHDTAIDNGDPEGDELLIPGLVNLNTAPASLLEQALPIPDATLRARVVSNIVAYRDLTSPYDGTGRNKDSNYRSRKGIAFLGELLGADQPASGASRGGLGNLATNGTDDGTLNGTVVDFLNPDASSDDQIIDDREEKTLPARWLMQVGSTRSDFFTAYVVIRGYPAQDFRLGVVESKRFLAIFDRSTSAATGLPARIIGYYEIP